MYTLVLVWATFSEGIIAAVGVLRLRATISDIELDMHAPLSVISASALLTGIGTLAEQHRLRTTWLKSPAHTLGGATLAGGLYQVRQGGRRGNPGNLDLPPLRAEAATAACKLLGGTRIGLADKPPASDCHWQEADLRPIVFGWSIKCDNADIRASLRVFSP